VSLIGRTGRDVELKFLESGRVVGKLTLAVKDVKDRTSWFDVEIWGPLAERAAEQVRKGSQICVQGRLRQDEWQDQMTGKKRYKTLVVASVIDFVSSAPGMQPQHQQQPDYAQPAQQAQPAQGASWNQPQQGWQPPRVDVFEQSPPPGEAWSAADNVIPGIPPMVELPMPAPETVSKSSTTEEKWAHLLANRHMYFDNRTNKNNPKSPDFVLKNRNREDENSNVALWLSSRDTPEWAKRQLAVDTGMN
jgi:single-strand DNA-binding protein